MLFVSWQGTLGNEADQFAAVELDGVAGGLPANGFYSRTRGCGAIIDEIHADLCPPIDKEAQGSDRRQPAVALADLVGDCSGNAYIGCTQEDVEGDEDRPGPDDNRARRPYPGRAEIRFTPRVVNIPGEGLIFPPPDVGQIAALRPGGRFAIEVDGHIQFFSDAMTQLSGQESAIFKLRVANRHERDHIGRAQSGMDAPMPPEVNASDSHLDRVEQPLQNRFRRARNRENGAIVVCIARAIEKPGAGPLDCCCQFVDDIGAAALRKIGNRFNDWCVAGTVIHLLTG